MASFHLWMAETSLTLVTMVTSKNEEVGEVYGSATYAQ
jgi:hypothetical protein